jgi:hypothetical protein
LKCAYSTFRHQLKDAYKDLKDAEADVRTLASAGAFQEAERLIEAIGEARQRMDQLEREP